MRTRSGILTRNTKLSARGFFFLSSLFALIVVITSCKPAQAIDDTLLVGIYPTKPFVILNGNTPRGFAIDLWKEMAHRCGLKYHFVVSTTINGALEDITEERVDIALGALTITRLREQLIDFTYPYFHTGLGILVPKKRTISPGIFLQSIVNGKRLKIFGVLLAVLLISGHIIWLVERRHDREQPSFDKRYIPGVLEGIYWAIVTASTVGYGDKVAKSWLGRLLVVMLILFALPLFAYSTAKLASDITLHEIRTGINGPKDLIERRVGVLEGTTSQDYVEKLGCIKLVFNRIETAYAWLQSGRLDAIVHDRPALLYYANSEKGKDVEVIEATFSPQDYGIALTENSPLREQLNRVLLGMIEDGSVNDLHDKWFGDH
ncbi:MAG TPA: transporter substrate-binding domain-containing protein [Desulfobulbus sp.]|nr:transporter substrate-binding domain-containing protein [Desulfobulbus sp.]